MGAVLATVRIWYLGDGLYNDYEEYQTVIGDACLECGVVAGLVVYCDLFFLGAACARAVNRHLLKRQSRLLFYAKTGKITDPSMQRNIDQLAKALLICWLIIMAIALHARAGILKQCSSPTWKGIS